MEWYYILIIVISALVLLATLFIVFSLLTEKMFAKIRVNIKEEEKRIDEALLLRHDELNLFVKVTKDFIDPKKDIFSKVLKLRVLDEKATIQEKEIFTNDMIHLIAEFWDTLIINREKLDNKELFDLYEKTLSLEENLLATQRLYNASVTFYNLKISNFPFSLIARLKGYKKKDFFEIDEFKSVKFEFEKKTKKD